MNYVSNPCKNCKNVDICKFALTSCEALEGLRIGDGSGPFTVSVDCKYRATAYVRSANNLLNQVIVTENKNQLLTSYEEGESK